MIQGPLAARVAPDRRFVAAISPYSAPYFVP